MSKTDRCLKDKLNSNQASRERLCLRALNVQDNFTDVRPRLPKGGPDGGRDIQCLYKGRSCFGAVGFVNDATDLNEHRNRIKKKFNEDLENAISAAVKELEELHAFVFFTNVGLTPSIISEMERLARDKNIGYCRVFDREQLCNILDSPKGYAFRFEFLEIAMNTSEQFDLFNFMREEIQNFRDEATDRLEKIEENSKRQPPRLPPGDRGFFLLWMVKLSR